MFETKPFPSRLIVGSAVAVVLFASAGCASSHEPAPVKADPSKSKLAAGCKIFRVYAQNRFEPSGTAVRTKPTVLAPMSGSFSPNAVIPVDGWEHTGTVAYPTNSKPIRNDIWYHVAHIGESKARADNPDDAWVSFAGVRGVPTSQDVSGGYSAKLGKLAESPPECEIRPAIDVE